MKNRAEDEARQKVYPEDIETEKEFKALHFMYIAALIILIIGCFYLLFN